MGIRQLVRQLEDMSMKWDRLKPLRCLAPPARLERATYGLEARSGVLPKAHG
jgi:hypothetical protein